MKLFSRPRLWKLFSEKLTQLKKVTGDVLSLNNRKSHGVRIFFQFRVLSDGLFDTHPRFRLLFLLRFHYSCSTIQFNFPVKPAAVTKLMPGNLPFRLPSGNDGRMGLIDTSLLIITPLLRLLQRLDLFDHSVEVAFEQPVLHDPVFLEFAFGVCSGNFCCHFARIL